MKKDTCEVNMPPKAQTRESKLGSLKPRMFDELCGILMMNNDWKMLAAELKHPNGQPKFKDWQLNKFSLSGDPAKLVIRSLMTSNTSIGHLIEILEGIELYRAAHFLSVDVLDESPKSLPYGNTSGSSARTVPEYSDKDMDQRISPGKASPASSHILYLRERGEIGSSSPDDTQIKTGIAIKYKPGQPYRFQYSDLMTLTNNFNNIQKQEGGNLLGSGGFADVFYGQDAMCTTLAVKRFTKLSKVAEKQFHTEVEVLSWFDHENLLPLVGFSVDGPHHCIVYRYMKNGSLQERLACDRNTAPLSAELRLSIAVGTARGIHQLHTQNPAKALIHRDIKSANILLDKDFVPKVGDFGTARIMSNEDTSAMTSQMIGTQTYMPPEAFELVYTVHYDAYSFGVVLLELLTGLKPFDVKRPEDQRSLIAFVDTYCEDNSLSGLLDPRAGPWEERVAQGMHSLADMCLQSKRQKRPLIKTVLEKLEELNPK